MEDIHPRGGGARGRSVLECGRSKELRKKKACCFLNQTTKDEEKLWAVEKWKSKSRIPTFPPPRMPAAQGKKRRLHKTLDAPGHDNNGRLPESATGRSGGAVASLAAAI